MKFNIETGQIAATIDFIEEELEDIKQIVSNLISFADRTRVVMEEFDISDLLLSIIALIRIDARRRNIDITFSPPECPVVIRIEADTVERGGKPMARIRFMDDGCGIRDEDPSNIFLPFYSSKLGKDANLGLGLSVSYGIISKYNGSIDVRNREQGGCEFTILLPGVPCASDKRA